MLSTEKELHKLLTDLAPGIYEPEEESKIIAVANNIFNRNINGVKKAQLNSKIKLSQLTDSLLQAMGQLDEWTEPAYIDGRNLSPDQIVRKAASNNKDQMNIVNDEDVLSFLEIPDRPEEFLIDDGEYNHNNHPTNVFTDKPKIWGRDQKLN